MAPCQGPSITSIPDEILVSVLSCLSQCERQRTALVCRRWRQLLNSSPQLLQTVDACFEGAAGAARLQYFCAWVLEHAAGHVERLNLEVRPDHAENVGEQVAAAIASIAVGCGMAGALRELRLAGSICHPDFWAGGLRSLRRLAIGESEGDNDWLSWDPPARALPSLEELWLNGDMVRLAPSACLPTALTSLRMTYPTGDSLPTQFSALARLQELCLENADYTAEGHSALAHLPSLRRLMLIDMADVPACLPQMSRLEALSLTNPSSGMDTLIAALPCLQHLTGLMLSVTASQELPAQLVHITNLHSLAWVERNSEYLPEGTWLSSLRRLAAPGSMLAASLPALAASSRLEFLGFLDSYLAGFLESPQAGATWTVVGGLPALRRLAVHAIDVCWEQSSVEQAFAEVARRNPALHFERFNCLTYDDLYSACWCPGSVDTSGEAFLGLQGEHW